MRLTNVEGHPTHTPLYYTGPQDLSPSLKDFCGACMSQHRTVHQAGLQNTDPIVCQVLWDQQDSFLSYCKVNYSLLYVLNGRGMSYGIPLSRSANLYCSSSWLSRRSRSRQLFTFRLRPYRPASHPIFSFLPEVKEELNVRMDGFENDERSGDIDGIEFTSLET